MFHSALRRVFFYIQITAILIASTLGIVVVIRDEWGKNEWRVMATTWLMGSACLCAMCCDLSRSPRGINAFPITGLTLTALATLLILGDIWIDSDVWVWWGGDRQEYWKYNFYYWKVAYSTAVFATAFAHMSLLTIARLSKRFQFVLIAAYCIIFSLAAVIVKDLWRDDYSHGTRQTIWVLSILSVAITLIVPLLHRLSRTDPGVDIASLSDEKNAAWVEEQIEQSERRLAQLRQIRDRLQTESSPPTPKPHPLD